MPIKDIAKEYDKMTYSAISQICRRIDIKRKEDRVFDLAIRLLENKMSNVKS